MKQTHSSAGIAQNTLLAVVRFFQRVSDERLAKKLVKRIYSLPKEEWIEVEHTFNRWRFPMKFYDLMPKWWLKKWDKQKGERAIKIISPVMNIVHKEFGNKEELRYHNVYLGKMTNDEFEYWYDFARGTESISAYYDKKFNVEKIKWWDEDVYKKLSELNVW